jgi:anti-sigma factor RsiW
MMDHEQALELVPGYQDGELSLSESLAFERHMAQCETCRLEYARQREASTQLRQADLRVTAPADLARRIEAALPGRNEGGLAGRIERGQPWRSEAAPPGRTEAAMPGQIEPEMPGRRTPWQRLLDGLTAGGGKRSVGWAPLGLSMASVAALAVSLSLFLQLPTDEQRLSQELVDNNIRSMQVDHLFDVASTDQHTVKPWFGGKLDFAPPVVDLAAQGYPLKGGRVDYLDGQRVAVMVYRDKLHPISLYVWPGNGEDTAPRFQERLGFHIAHWYAAGMNHWAITDAGEGDLRGFVTQMRGNAGS